MNKYPKKRAIALITLVVTILVLIMISGIITYVAHDMISLADETAYAKDMQTITDGLEEYYVVNGSIPVLEGGLELDAKEYVENIKSLLDEDAEETLLLELEKNNDENATFYEIDVSIIGVDELSYGLKESEYDVYLVSNYSHNVYYYQGYEIDGNVYFSNINIIDKNS